MKIQKPDGSFEEAPESENNSSSKSIGIFSERRLNKRRLAIIAFVFVALISTALFVTKFGTTAFNVKEEKEETPQCVSECEFEGKACENGKIFECAIGQDGCKHKNLVESCPEGSICSKLKEGTCYTPQTCDFEFHTCASTTSYKLCNNGKTVEGAETKKCPEKLVCNKSPKNFALCVEKR